MLQRECCLIGLYKRELSIPLRLRVSSHRGPLFLTAVGLFVFPKYILFAVFPEEWAGKNVSGRALVDHLSPQRGAPKQNETLP